tara:strand:- start:113 stop:898 length:786 start_codon:yes stop_codon:yes gene_type:complete
LSDKIRRILNHESPDIILNLAAYTNVEKAEEQREIAFAVNGDALTQICSEISVYNSKQNKNLPLIHFSTDYVFDGGGVEPIRPCARMNPLNVYGQSKAEGEKNILSSPISYLIFRTSWVVSKYRNNFVKTILRKIENDSEINVVGDQYGAPTTAEFIADFLGQLIEDNSLQTRKGVYHICGKGETTWFELANFVFENFKKLKGIPKEKSFRINRISTDEMQSVVKRPRNSRLCCDSLKNTFSIEQIHWKTQVEGIIKDLLQ